MKKAVDIRAAAVAGTFYPENAIELREMVRTFLAEATALDTIPKAVIAPHAGYIYSGPIAGTAYAQVAMGKNQIKRVVILGPSHRMAFRGMALSSAHSFATPLGNVSVDAEMTSVALSIPQVSLLDAAHAQEHGLEVQLPFLQEILDTFAVLPVVVGDATAEEVKSLIDKLWGGPETLIVASSDLSHYQDYDTARRMDEGTSASD